MVHLFFLGAKAFLSFLLRTIERVSFNNRTDLSDLTFGGLKILVFYLPLEKRAVAFVSFLGGVEQMRPRPKFYVLSLGQSFALLLGHIQTAPVY